MSTEVTDGGAPAGEEALSEADANRLHEARQKIIDELGKIIVGQEEVIDEIMIYERLLQPYEIMQLAGRLFLDLSGNKYHAAAMGGIDMTDSDRDEIVADRSDRRERLLGADQQIT